LEGFPGLYSSKRNIGDEKNITIHKFRVMKKDIDKKLNRASVLNDHQLFLNLPINKAIYTNFGLKLERFGITELPQFFSVMIGDMSIVGARPLPQDVYDILKKKFPNIAQKRYITKCGLTGLPQLVGRDFLSDKERLELEALYCSWAKTNYNLIVDLKIIIYTVLIVLGIKKHFTFGEVIAFLQ